MFHSAVAWFAGIGPEHRGVFAVESVPSDLVAAQIGRSAPGHPRQAIKIGMPASAEIVRAVADATKAILVRPATMNVARKARLTLSLAGLDPLRMDCFRFVLRHQNKEEASFTSGRAVGRAL